MGVLHLCATVQCERRLGRRDGLAPRRLPAALLQRGGLERLLRHEQERPSGHASNPGGTQRRPRTARSGAMRIAAFVLLVCLGSADAGAYPQCGGRQFKVRSPAQLAAEAELREAPRGSCNHPDVLISRAAQLQPVWGARLSRLRAVAPEQPEQSHRSQAPTQQTAAGSHNNKTLGVAAPAKSSRTTPEDAARSTERKPWYSHCDAACRPGLSAESAEEALRAVLSAHADSELSLRSMGAAIRSELLSLQQAISALRRSGELARTRFSGTDQAKEGAELEYLWHWALAYVCPGQGTGEAAPPSAIEVALATNFASNAALGRIIGVLHPARTVAAAGGHALLQWQDADVDRALGDVRDQGHVLLTPRLDANATSRLRDLALSAAGIVGCTGPTSATGCVGRAAQQAGLEPFVSVSLQRMLDLQLSSSAHAAAAADLWALVTEPLLLRLAQSYLGCEPQIARARAILTTHGAHGKFGFHQDYTTPQLVKFFVYLEPLAPRDGAAHLFISRSHRNQRPILAYHAAHHGSQYRYWVRLPDEAVAKAYPSDWPPKAFNAMQAGQIVMEDTTGLHAGTPATSGKHRLVLEIEFSSSGTKFGTPEPVQEHHGGREAPVAKFCRPTIGAFAHGSRHTGEPAAGVQGGFGIPDIPRGRLQGVLAAMARHPRVFVHFDGTACAATTPHPSVSGEHLRTNPSPLRFIYAGDN